MAAAPTQADECGPRFRLINAAPRPRELTGAVDLLSHYGLRETYETFCQKPIPLSIGESSYLKSVVGDMEIRRGEGMELGQLLGPDSECPSLRIRQFDLDVLHQAFSLRESGPIALPEVDRGVPTASAIVKEENKEKIRKHKKHKKHKDRHNDKEYHKDRDREKDKDKDKNRDKDHSKKYENGEDHSKKHHRKKRKHDGEDEEGEGHKHRKKKHKRSSKPEVPELINKA